MAFSSMCNMFNSSLWVWCAIVGRNPEFRCRKGGGHGTADWDAAVG